MADADDVDGVVEVRPTAGAVTEEDAAAERSLRPRSLAEFIGQARVKQVLSITLTAARERGEAPDHMLFSGPPGLGKTTLAQIVAHEQGVRLHTTSGPALERSADLVGLLTRLGPGDVLFIDEVHRLHAAVAEYLYAAMEDFAVDIVLDQGPRARTVRMSLQPFTLVAATTREGLLAAPFRERFLLRERLDLYPDDELREICGRAARLLGVALAPDAAVRLASAARGTPRVAQRFLRRVRDLAQVEGGGTVTKEIADRGLAMLGVDDRGLEELDRRLLRALVEARGQPVGLKTLAVRVGEPEDTLEDVYEPFLIRGGWLLRTSRGRVAGPRALAEAGIPANAPSLFPG